MYKTFEVSNLKESFNKASKTAHKSIPAFFGW